ncbi:probable halolysin at N-terminal half [Coccomyxa sp. Obi]|nr:probable halolysin at N-terminal half [Coccomyxa sp. Obi]
MPSNNVRWSKTNVWNTLWTALLLLCLNEGALCIESRQGVTQRALRVLFKPKNFQQGTPVSESFVSGLSKKLRVLQRRLMQSGGPSELQVQSLGTQTDFHMIDVPQGLSVSDVLKALQDHPGIEHAEVDKVLTAYSQPNDPDLPQQWAMYRLGLFTDSLPVNGQSDMGAWNRSTGSPEVVVCVIDSGIDYTHPDLQGNVWTNHGEIPNNGIDDDKNGYIDDVHGFNFLSNTGDPMDNNYHGTHLSGMVGALCNNNIGVCGVNQNVKVMACKFLDGSGNGYTSDAVRCLNYALEMGADITLNSYGGLYADSYALQSAIEAADQKGQLFVTAAGNDYGVDIDATPTYPAAYRNRNIMSVIATDQNDGLANYSNYGQKNADIAAPGSKILSTILNGQYGMHEGTSQSAGFVAGAAALLLAAHKAAGTNASGADMKDPLMRGVLPSAALTNKCGAGGMLNIGRSMALVPPQLEQPMAEVFAPAPAQVSGPLVAEAPSLNSEPIQVSKPQLVLGNYPPAPDDLEVRSKSISADAAPPSPPSNPGLPPSIVQYFSGGFPLWHSTMIFLPLYGGSFKTCSMSGVNQLPSNFSYGTDITQQLLTGPAVTIDLGDSGVQIGGVNVQRLEVRPDGTLRLLSGTGNSQPVSAQSQETSSGTAGSSEVADFQSVPQIGVLAAAGLSLQDGGQVSWYMRPDRVVVSFMYVASTQAPQKSNFQVEVFTRSGHYEPAGTVRMTWLDVGVQSGVVGISNGASATPAGIDFRSQALCQVPAKLWVDPAASQPVVLAAAHPGQAAAAAPRNLYIANKGNTSLTLALTPEPRSDSVLQPNLWLDPSSDYSSALSEQSAAAAGYEFDESGGAGNGAVSIGAGERQPARYAQSLQAPMRLSGQVQRDRPYTDQFLVLSTTPTPPDQPGESESLFVGLDCGQRIVRIPGLPDLGQGDSCVDFGSIGMTVELGPSTIIVSVDDCLQLAGSHSLGSGPFYLFLGANCSSDACPGGVVWERLEVQTGPDVLIQAPEGLALGPSAPSKILVMQAPGSAALGSLQDLLSLPPYPAAPASGPVPPPPAPIVLPPTPYRASPAAPSSGAQVSAASVEQQQGRRLLLSGAENAAAGSSGVLQMLKKAYIATMRNVLNAAAGGKHATVAAALGQKTAEGDSPQEGLGAATGGSNKGVAGAAAAPAAEGLQQAGEGVSVEGKRTKLRMGLNLPGEDELSAVAFLDVGPPDEAVSPEGGPGGNTQPVGGPAEVAVSWVSLSSSTLVVPAYGSQAMQLTFNSAGLSAGSYQAQLMIQSNDPDQPFQRLPLHLQVV